MESPFPVLICPSEPRWGFAYLTRWRGNMARDAAPAGDENEEDAELVVEADEDEG